MPSFRFQSPKSGKFESNPIRGNVSSSVLSCFNPLNRGNLNQIMTYPTNPGSVMTSGFNPLNRGNLNQMVNKGGGLDPVEKGFNPLNRGNLNQIFAQKPYSSRHISVSIP